jgi:hypothetical protein
MNKLVVVFSMLAATSVAQAQPSPTAPSKVTAAQYVETDLVVGGTAPVAGPSIVLAAQGGYRLSQALWLHGEVSYGDARDDQGRGPAEQLHAGLEGRTCIVHGVLCGIAGADLGYQHGSWTSDRRATDMETVDALVVVPRAGVDVGGDHVRMRLGVETDLALAGRHRDTAGTMSPTNVVTGIGLGLGVAYQW